MPRIDGYKWTHHDAEDDAADRPRRWRLDLTPIDNRGRELPPIKVVIRQPKYTKTYAVEVEGTPFEWNGHTKFATFMAAQEAVGEACRAGTLTP